MQWYAFFRKGIYTLRCTMASGKAPRSWGFFENFCVKTNIAVCLLVLLLTVDYRKNGGAGCTSCSPNNFVGEQLLPPVPAPKYEITRHTESLIGTNTPP